jgi:hypothetical protein
MSEMQMAVLISGVEALAQRQLDREFRAADKVEVILTFE